MHSRCLKRRSLQVYFDKTLQDVAIMFKRQCCIPCLLVHIWQAFFTDFAASRTRLSETYELIPIVRNYIIYSAKSINSILQSSLERLLGHHLLSYLFIVLTLAKPPMDNSSGIQGVHHCLPALTWPQDPQGVNRVRFAEKNGQDVKCFKQSYHLD